MGTYPVRRQARPNPGRPNAVPPRRRANVAAGVAVWLCVAAAASPGRAQEARLSVVSWNVESGGARPQTVAARVRAFQGVTLWGFSEVESDAWLVQFEAAAEDGEGGRDFARVLGTTGGADRLGVVYDATRFEKVRHFELAEVNVSGSVRAPLVAHLRDRATGDELLFMVNHLYRSNADGRHEQARRLHAWGRRQTLPVIAVGDYNFDWEVTGGDARHDAGYDHMTADGVFSWVRPATLVKSQCSPQFDSVLDFVFVTPPARAWAATSAIETEAGDCGDTANRPDHRPVTAAFTLRAAPVAVDPAALAALAALKRELLDRIAALEAELRAVRAAVERLPE